MQFLTTDDFNGIIGGNTLTSLRGVDDANLVRAEVFGLSELAPLRGNFDIDYELALAGDARNMELVRIVIHLVAYYLYNTVQDDEIPERITENYTNQVKLIGRIADGNVYTTIKPLLDASSQPKTNYRFGGDAPRDNDIF